MRPRNGVDLLVSILKGILPLKQVASNPAPQNGQVWVQPDGLRFQADSKTVKAADADALVRRQFYGNLRGLR